MVKTVLSLAGDDFSKPVYGIHRLGIHFNSTYIGLLVINKEQNKVAAFQLLEPEEQFNVADGAAIRKMLDSLIAGHEWFSDNTITTTVLIPGNGFTLVPVEAYDSYNKEQLLEPQYQVQTSDIVFAEQLADNPVMAVYTLPWGWSQQLRSHFTDLKLIHEDVCWLNLAISTQGKNLPDKAAVLYVEPDKLKIQLIEKGKLLYFNSFYFQDNYDILYYLQLALSQFGMGTAATDILLAGTGYDDLALETFLKQYTLSINPLKFPFFNTLPVAMRKYYPTHYLALFSTAICG